MIIEMKQNQKELYKADFTFWHGNIALGNAVLEGKLGHREGTWSIDYAGTSISMKYGKKNIDKNSKPFRPYDIFINGNGVGTAYQTNEGGLFSKYPVHKLYLNNNIYTLYPICFGEEGAKSPVYWTRKQTAEVHKSADSRTYQMNQSSEQIAEIHKSAIIHDDLHTYQINLISESHALIGILLCCYAYALGLFRPGQKTIKGTRKLVSVDTNKNLLAKYNPEWMSYVKP